MSDFALAASAFSLGFACCVFLVVAAEAELFRRIFCHNCGGFLTVKRDPQPGMKRHHVCERCGSGFGVMA